MIRTHVPEVLREWEILVREQPWFSLPQEHRIDSLPAVVAGIGEAALCAPRNEQAYRGAVEAAAAHGTHRREQCVPDHLILTEYHLLRQAIWRFLARREDSPEMVQAILQIDAVITLASNASMWGYHRPEVEAMGRWEAAMERIITDSPVSSQRHAR